MSNKQSAREQKEYITKIFEELIDGRNDHERQQIDSCVCCVTCDKRLHQRLANYIYEIELLDKYTLTKNDILIYRKILGFKQAIEEATAILAKAVKELQGEQI